MARVEVTFPRERAPRELTRWRVSPGDVVVDLPQEGNRGFLGGLVHGAFSEDYAVQLDISVARTKDSGRLAAVAAPARQMQAVPVAARQTFRTEFLLPFIETARWGNMPRYDDDTLVELAFADPDALESIAARVNGQHAPVQRYVYPRRPEWWSYYVELTGAVEPGHVTLEVEVTWRQG